MARIIDSLQTKLIASLILLIIIVAGGTFFYTYNETKNALVQSSRDEIRQVIGIIAQQFTNQDIQTLVNLQPGQENTSAYLALNQKMQSMRALSPDIINIYTMNISEGKVSFIIDDDYPNNGGAMIGQVYDQPEACLFNITEGIQVSPNVYSDEFGSYLSGYAPLNATASNYLLAVGADMNAAQVVQRENFIGNTIYLIIGISVGIAAAIIGAFSVTVVRDLKKLNATANEISQGNTNVIVNVKRKDEIGELADSFSRMVASLKFMMSEQDEQKNQ